MSNPIQILSPNREVNLSGLIGTVVVRELSWKAQRDLLARLEDGLVRIAAAQSGVIDPQAVLALLRDSQELSELVLRETTGLSPERIGQLSLTEFFGLLDVALELNVTSLADGAKKAFGRITSFVGKGAAGTVPTKV